MYESTTSKEIIQFLCVRAFLQFLCGTLTASTYQFVDYKQLNTIQWKAFLT